MQHERGNVLFLILLAVVLFAALSYAVTQSMRGGGKDASTEKARAEAAGIIDAATTLQQNVSRMLLTGNIPLLQLDFSGTGSAAGTNTACTTNACKVFDPSNSGALILPGPGAYYPFSRKLAYFVSIQIPNVRSSLSELAVLYTDINEETCKQINSITGVVNSNGGLPPNDGWGPNGGYWQGAIASFPEAASSAIESANSQLYGKTDFCIRQDYVGSLSDGTLSGMPDFSTPAGTYPLYYYIHVLVER